MASNGHMPFWWSDSAGAAIPGLRATVHEREMEVVFMTRDDLENYESRVSDRRLFENLAILLIGASVPLGVEKYLELRDEAGDPPSSTEGILIVCAGAALFGLIAGVVAVVRAIRVKRYRKKLFSSEKQVAALTFLQSGTVQPTPTSAQEGSDD